VTLPDVRRGWPWACLSLCLALLLGPVDAAPRAPVPQAAGPSGPPSTLLMEVSTGQVLQASEPHRRLPPASLNKLMTFDLTLQAIKDGHLTLSTPVTVSTEAWRVARRYGTSRMFLNAGDEVTVEQLLLGMMVASGNDAAQALAEAEAGSAEQFAAEMNAAAGRLGMRDSHFVTPHGLPAPDEYTSAWDMALLARHILLTFPDCTRFTSPQYETYGGIRQANWNNLVFRDSRVDGLKTGSTAEAGENIVATAREGSMRLIAVVMGARTVPLRTASAEGMLNFGFGRYALLVVPWQRVVPDAVTIYGGTAARLPLDTSRPVEVLLSRDVHAALTVSEELTVRPLAPFQRGQQVGVLTVHDTVNVLARAPVLAAATVPRSGWIARIWGLLRYRIGELLHRRQTTWTGTFTPSE